MTALRRHRRKLLSGALALLTFSSLAAEPVCALDGPTDPSAPDRAAIQRELRGDLSFLSDDDLHGRGSATRDEHIAALFAASQMQALGLEPGGGRQTFIQRGTLPSPLPAHLQQRLAGFEQTPRIETWNAIGILRGTSPDSEAVLLTAHLDHLGVAKRNPAKPGADLIYNGADDDASGTAAVLTLAHLLASGPRPCRSVIFALFGSEEIGGFGNRLFLEHPPFPLGSIVANLEFEMIGRPDRAVPPGTLWLTGFERSDLGPELVKHGAHLVQDPHPAEQFFRRSDNYALATRGVVAHTVSSFGLHKDYHHPSDEISTIDFNHMTDGVASMLEPIRWLASTSWKPTWGLGGRPTADLPGSPSPLPRPATFRSPATIHP